MFFKLNLLFIYVYFEKTMKICLTQLILVTRVASYNYILRLRV